MVDICSFQCSDYHLRDSKSSTCSFRPRIVDRFNRDCNFAHYLDSSRRDQHGKSVVGMSGRCLDWTCIPCNTERLSIFSRNRDFGAVDLACTVRQQFGRAIDIGRYLANEFLRTRCFPVLNHIIIDSNSSELQTR